MCLAPAMAAAQTIRSASGANPAEIQATVDQFRADLGGGIIPGPNGGFGGLRREITWDSVPDALATPADLPNDFFNVNSPRGIVLTAQDGVIQNTTVRVSMDDNTGGDADPDEVRFSDLNATYAAKFQAFSGQRIFGTYGTNRLDVRFYLPGTTTRAVVRGFGAVFTGVEMTISSMTLYDADDQQIGRYAVPVGDLSFIGVSFPDARIGRVVLGVGNTPIGFSNEFPNGVDAAAMDDFIYGEPALRKYILAEGATSAFFDTDVMIANPMASETTAALTFFKQDGTTVADNRVIPARTRVTVHVKDVPGLESSAASTLVVPQNGQPLAVERTMFWDTNRYGGHTGGAVTSASTKWLFAEGAQGFFDTFLLVTNQNATASTVTLTFLRENEPPVVKVKDIGAHTRLSVPAGEFPELSGRAFAVIVESPVPVVAERAMYFGSTPGQLWKGGHESAGVAAPSKTWEFSEGAMGAFFDTFLLLMNPGDTDAQVTMTYLREGGSAITVNKMVGAKQRLTVKLEDEAPELASGSAGTSITSTQPIVAERSMYWVGEDGQPWTEAHNSFGLIDTALRWAMAEGRLGGPEHFRTYLLIANPSAGTFDVKITFLRETGDPIEKSVPITPNSRVTVDVAALAPELQNQSFGALVEGQLGGYISVERSMYWDANGIFWAGGSSGTATPLSAFVQPVTPRRRLMSLITQRSLIAILIAAGSTIPAIAAAQTVRSASGANAAAIQAAVDQFRADLGGGNIGGPNGSFGGLRREINWDTVPDAVAAPNAFPENFFNTTSPRGLVMNTSFHELRVSMDDNTGGDADPDLVRFSEISPGYAAQFQTFSAQRLAGLLGTDRLSLFFKMPGTDKPAVVRGFGAVFTGVDGVLDSHFPTNIDFYDPHGDFIASAIVPSGAVSFVGVSFPEARIGFIGISVGNLPLDGGAEQPGLTDAVAMDDFIYGEPELQKYVLSEGATGFFDTDVVLANPNANAEPVKLTFLKEDGSSELADREVPGRSRLTVSLKTIDGLAATPVSTIVVPQNGHNLGVERTMFWGANRYGGHTGNAVTAGSNRWLFAEGAQGFFDTFLLITNQHDTPATVTFTFLRESEPPFVTARDVGPHARLTLQAREFPELVGRAFGIIVESPQTIGAERAMYFGTTPDQLWTGGDESPGVRQPSYNWYFSEGATGSFFDTFVLLMNPGDVEATVDVTYLRDAGDPITVHKVLAPKQRLTINMRFEAPELAVGSAGTEVHASVPIVAERSMYWTGSDAQPWTESHNSFGVNFPAFDWALAEGRVGGPEKFRTYILLASIQDDPTPVRLSFLRESGTPIHKIVNIPAHGRYTFDVSAEMPELQNESFSTIVTSWGGGSFLAERSIYWDANGVVWAGGTSGTPVLLPQTTFIP